MSATGRAEIRTTPYKGLTHYTEDDEAYFFGRTQQREFIVTHLKAHRLTLLFGESGVGKTSMLRAGVMASLRRDALRDAAEEAVRTEAGVPVVEYVPVAFALWRDDPVAGVARAIENAMRELVDDAYESPDTRALELLIDHAAAHTNGYLLIVLDQFEEYFLYYGAETGPDTFAGQLGRAVRNRELAANFLISMREDALAKLDPLKSEIPRLFESTIRVRHLSMAAAREAIVRPIERYNRLAPDQPHVDPPDEAFVTAVLEQVPAGALRLGHAGRGAVEGDSQAAGRPDEIETAFLQLVMRRLWEEEVQRRSHVLRVSTLTELGGAAEIVRSHIDDKLDELTPRQRDVAADVFDHLVTPSGTKIAHSAADLAHYSDHRVDEVAGVLTELAEQDTWILRPVPAPPGEDAPPRYEIFHDILAGAILGWRERRITERLEREKSEAQKREHVQRQAKLAAQQRVKLLRLALGAAGVLLLAGLVAFIVALSARGNREHAANESRRLAAAALEGSNLEQSSLLALEALKLSDTFDARSAVLELADNHELSRPLASVPTPATLDVAFSPGGGKVATAGYDGNVRLWRASDHHFIGALTGHKGPVNAVKFDHSGTLIATAGADKTVRLWRVATRTEIGRPLVGHTGPVNTVAFDHDGKLLASAGEDRTIRLWKVSTRRSYGKPLRGETGPINDLAISPDGKTIASASCHQTLHDDPGDHLVRLWSVARRRQIGNLKGHTKPVCGVAFTSTGDRLVSAGDDKTLRVWDVKTRKATGPALTGHTDLINSVALNRAGTMAATTGRDRTVRLWDLRNRRQAGLPLVAHTGIGEGVAFNPRTATLASAGGDGVRLWSVAAPSVFQTRAVAAKGKILSIAFNRDGTKLGWIADDKTAHILDTTNGAEKVTHGPLGSTSGAAFSPDGRWFAWTGYGDRTVRLWDYAAADKPMALTAPAPKGEVLKGIAFSPDGRLLAYGDSRVVSAVEAKSHGVVRLWDLKEGRALPALPGGHEGQVHALAFSPDGKMLASAGDDKLVRLWDVDGRRQIASLRGHTGNVYAVTFGPKGKTLASAGTDESVRLWDVASKRQRGAPMARPGTVYSVSYDPDADHPLLASGSGDGPVQVWDAKDQRALGATFLGHVGAGFGVAFSPNGKRIASAGEDGTVRLWRAPSLGRAKSRLCGYIDGRDAKRAWHQIEPSVEFRDPCPPERPL